MRFSIIYAQIRPEIKERISVGLIVLSDNGVKIRYSEKKLRALKGLFPPAQYGFLAKVIRSMPNNESIKSVEAVEYLSRYSNNTITVSKIDKIDLEQTKQNEEWLYSHYVYKKQK